MRFARGWVLTGAIASMSSGAEAATFQINVNFEGDAQYESYFQHAVQFWEARILGRWNDFDAGPLLIDATTQAIDGAGSTLAAAAPQLATCSDGSSDLAGCRARGEYVFATSGQLILDEDDLENASALGLLDDIIRHEIAHVLGFGTLWELNQVYTPPLRDLDGDGIDENTANGAYTAPFALAAYQAEFDSAAAFVPIEGNHGTGTADVHWDEFWPGGENALMTGFFGLDQTFLTNTTLQSFRDIGYMVAVPVPLPAAALTLASALGMVLIARRRPTRRRRGSLPKSRRVK